jgi:hypothetical protein
LLPASGLPEPAFRFQAVNAVTSAMNNSKRQDFR